MAFLLVISAFCAPFGVADLAAAGNVAANAENVGNASSNGHWVTKQGNTNGTGYAPAVRPPATDHWRTWEAVRGDRITSSPVVAYRTVYVGSESDGWLYALNATDGSKRWTFDAGAPVQSPSYDYGVVYVGDANGTFYALDATDGEVLWNRSLGDQIASAPTISDQTVYVTATNDSGTGTVWALDQWSGETRWQHGVDGPATTSPAVANETVFVSATGNVRALNASTGDQKWSVSAGGNTELTAPTVSNGTVFVADANEEAGSGNVLALDAWSGDDRWNYSTSAIPVGSPAVANDTVFVATSNAETNAVVRLDEWTGEASVATKSRDLRSAPVVAERTLFVGTANGLLATNATTGSNRYFHEVADGSGAVESAPAVGDRSVYFGVDHTDGSVQKVSGADFDYAPTADITADRTYPLNGTIVSFEAFESVDVDGPLRAEDFGLFDQQLSYEWDVDGDDEYEATGITHWKAFETPGEKRVRLRVTDGDNETDTAGVNVTVLDSRNFSFDYTVSDTNVTVGDTVVVNATVESSRDDATPLDVVLYKGFFTTNVRTVTVPANGEVNVSFTTSYGYPGNYSLTVGRANSTDVTVRDVTPPSAPSSFEGPYGWVGPSPELSWGYADDGEGFVDHYEIRVDDGEWQDAGYWPSTQLHNLSNGTHTVEVRAVDASGNAGPAVETNITVDANGPSEPGSVSVPDGWTDGTVPVSWAAASDDVSGLDRYEVFVGGSVWDRSEDRDAELSFRHSGNYTIGVRGIDAAGNSGPNATKSVRVDVDAPNVGTGLSVDSGHRVFTVNVTDRRSGVDPTNVTVSIDGESVSREDLTVTGDSVVYTRKFTAGTYNVSVDAVDAVGNRVEREMVFTVSGSGGGGSGGSDGSGGGGGGGGGSSNVPPPPVQVDVVERSDSHVRAKVSSARADAPARVSLSGIGSDGVTFRKLRVVPESEDAQPRFFLEAEAADSVSGSAPPADDVPGYLTVTSTYIDDDEMATVNVRFSVPANVGSPRGVTLYRRHDGEWKSVPTELVSERGGSYTFRATTDGVSVFAVGVSKVTTTVETTETTAETVETTTATATESALDDDTETATANETLAVRTSTTDSASANSTTTDATGSTPGFGAPVALLALAAGLLAASRRE